MRTNNWLGFGVGTVIGTLGCLIGLGGAEFRLPFLISLFRYGALEAVILNKAMSLVVVASALCFRTRIVPWDAIGNHWEIIINLLAGSLAGAWFGAGFAIRLKSATFYKIIALLLVMIAGALLLGHTGIGDGTPLAMGWMQRVLGVIAGFGIGIVASLLGVAGGELLIPTLILLFGVEIKLAGSLSLAVSLPTMVTGFLRYSRDKSFMILQENYRFVLIMAGGSMIGAFLGGILLGIVPEIFLLPALALILVISAAKVWRHQT